MARSVALTPGRHGRPCPVWSPVCEGQDVADTTAAALEPPFWVGGTPSAVFAVLISGFAATCKDRPWSSLDRLLPSNKRMQLTGASTLGMMVDNVHAGKSAQLMRGPLGSNEPSLKPHVIAFAH